MGNAELKLEEEQRKNNWADSSMQSHAVNEELHQDLNFFSAIPVFRVGLDATLCCSNKHLCALSWEATNLHLVPNWKESQEKPWPQSPAPQIKLNI